ncbi:hypothetical protein H4R34_001428 [Dimargaris verticillata]|uniref:WLM domain-containing protein n=1 Tax=Dimargaris verticillata TaxID=2761393 RepID=A0A9W8B9X9_9FUNG|nr:hypothetical protein H4R34_001428 [Dimargaris verticillata]
MPTPPSLKVRYQGQVHMVPVPHSKCEVDVEPTPQATNLSLNDLCQAIASHLDVPVEEQKLLAKGTVLTHHPLTTPLQPWATTLLPWLLPDAKGTATLPPPLLLLRVCSATAKAQLQHDEQQWRAARKNYDKYRVKEGVMTSRRALPGLQTLVAGPSFTFANVAVLPQYEHQARAQQVLERLRDDPGIQQIMTKYQWQVRLLQELCPIEHSHILGYNQNQGLVIAVRLRTDDLTGFRHYESVREVLLHELAHMVHSNHGPDFHALNRQLNKDVTTLDWTARGHKLTAAATGASAHGFERTMPPRQASGSLAPAAYALGGGGQASVSAATSAPDLTTGESVDQRRQKLLEAALGRLTQAEQELQDRCSLDP